uniref:Fungal-type protein kinase domain-containing protein n=1 Tax=Romanomermis culicivorax TaxID=13658 RepID=A0A915JLV8_ROMCU
MFFRKTPSTPTHTTAPPSIVCLSLSSRDSLQLIKGPRHLWRPLLDAVNSANSGPDVTIKDLDHQNLEIKLNGWPWENASLSEGVEARKILLAVFKTFDKMGYHFYGTANLKGKADSLFFIYDESFPGPGGSKHARLWCYVLAYAYVGTLLQRGPGLDTMGVPYPSSSYK